LTEILIFEVNEQKNGNRENSTTRQVWTVISQQRNELQG